MSEERKKSNKGKTALMFAFALTVLSSRASAAAAAAVPDMSGNFGEDTSKVDKAIKQSGGNPAYEALDINVYLATEQSHSTSYFYKTLDSIRDFAAYARNLNSNHVEGNIAVGKTNCELTYNTNVVKYGTNRYGTYKLYFASVDEFKRLPNIEIASGTKYELVLGFDHKVFTYDNGNKIGVIAGGVEYRFNVNGGYNNVSVRRATAEDKFADIDGTLNLLAQYGDAIMSDVSFDKADSAYSLGRAYDLIEKGSVTEGDVIVANVHADDLPSNESVVRALLEHNNGVRVIINVITDDTTKNVWFGNVNVANWTASASNVIFNFGSYTGSVSTGLNGGIFVAPYATFSNSGNVNGAVIASTINQTGEIHQVTNCDFHFYNDDIEDDTDTDTDEGEDVPDSDVPMGDSPEFDGDDDTDPTPEGGDDDTDPTPEGGDDDTDPTPEGGDDDTDPTPEGGDDDTDPTPEGGDDDTDPTPEGGDDDTDPTPEGGDDDTDPTPEGSDDDTDPTPEGGDDDTDPTPNGGDDDTDANDGEEILDGDVPLGDIPNSSSSIYYEDEEIRDMSTPLGDNPDTGVKPEAGLGIAAAGAAIAMAVSAKKKKS